jgi:hypothetical protein
MTVPPELAARIADELRQPVPAGVEALTRAILARHGAGVQAMLFYGSCLRSGDDQSGILDLYVLVRRYEDFYARRLWAWLNALLPPNVFYLAVEEAGRTVRVKYTVVSFAQFARATSPRAFHPYFWARFAQPTALVYARDATATEAVIAALAAAVCTFVWRVLPLLPPRFRAADLWVEGLTRTYGTELRTERPGTARALYAANATRYEQVTALALRALPCAAACECAGGEDWWTVALSARARRLAPAAWWLRRPVGKVLSILRLLKGAVTFEGGVEYALWKIERHSGLKADPAWRARRPRWLAAAAEFVRLYCKRGVR